MPLPPATCKTHHRTVSPADAQRLHEQDAESKHQKVSGAPRTMPMFFLKFGVIGSLGIGPLKSSASPGYAH